MWVGLGSIRDVTTSTAGGLRVGLAVLGAATLLTSCTSEVTGSPVTAAGPPPGTVDIASLDVGNYPTKPAPLGTAGKPEVGAIVEAQRMANYVIGPWEVDPALVVGYIRQPMVLLPGQVSVPMLKQVNQAAERYQFVNGFFVSRRSADDKTFLHHAVLRFPDPGAAAAATAEIARVAGEIQLPMQTSPATPLPIPGHPETVATSSTHNNGPRSWATVRSATPRGPYVLLQQAQAVDVDATAALVAKTLDLQGPLIDQFKATNPAEFADLPLDPTGLLAKTLPIAPKDAILTQRTVYQRLGGLQFQSDPVLSATAFTDAGVDLVSRGKTTVYQAADAASARQLADDFAEEVGVGNKPSDGVAQLPDSRCFSGDAGNHCIASADRYAFEVSATQIADAHQQLAAQYALLMAG
ncbi:hypothetical protein O6P37_26945 [Mycobacterium sp. CPCC 205372]|uniref:Uncharacterized protein n=1 Tax=Mycobacterium hippophais TaxID=3016340 RepID=A0ABT4Q162_9MYCO|nr:hypothetical protein [Mycobacterium hippophais]MCZ8382512.1 hypothetical protein [Mycobacterium hippophais]